MHGTNQAFRTRVNRALSDDNLRAALAKAKGGFVDKRLEAIAEVNNFDAMRDAARDVKEHSLANLDHYLEAYEQAVISQGGQVHWARDAGEACETIVGICRRASAKRIAKGKSMVSEEIDLNKALEQAGLEVVETDLGEYIIQLAGERPSHIIAPAVHKTRPQLTELFSQHHSRLGYTEPATTREQIVNEARAVLRDVFVNADVGITGANFLVAETGSSVIVTNEGNGDLASSVPRVQIVTASIEKVIPTLEDLSAMLRVLGRSATGQEMSVYTTLYGGVGPDRNEEGPSEYHVVLLDNGRSSMLAGTYREMLRCIRCGACLNHCPVYGEIGGHSYGWIYSGPMGAVLTPLMTGLDTAYDLPNACTLNGRCQEVCPVRIPLPEMIRKHRTAQYTAKLHSAPSRAGLSAWSWLTAHPRVYRQLVNFAAKLLGVVGRRRGAIRWLPFASGWTGIRDLPAPEGSDFLSAWQRRSRTPGSSEN
jgi:L-lactate dehydrogenase complex protein LldF